MLTWGEWISLRWQGCSYKVGKQTITASSSLQTPRDHAEIYEQGWVYSYLTFYKIYFHEKDNNESFILILPRLVYRPELNILSL